MGFSQSTITEVNPPLTWGSQISLSWASNSPVDTWYQVYLDRNLAWFGKRTSVRLPVPTSGPTRVDIGTVAAGEEQISFAPSLPSAPARRVQLTWLGGTFLGTDVAGFRVYGSDSRSGTVNYSVALADIVAYPAGILTDGYGLGRYGNGGYGQVAGTYTWLSDPLMSGSWNFAVAPYDAAGNLGTPATTSQWIAVPPLAPALRSNGTRCHYSYTGNVATLNWNASPM